LGEGDRLKEHPAVAPETDHFETDLPRARDGQIASTFGGVEDDLGSGHDLLGSQVPPDQSVEGVSLFVAQEDRHGFGTTHDCLLKGVRVVAPKNRLNPY